MEVVSEKMVLATKASGFGRAQRGAVTAGEGILSVLYLQRNGKALSAMKGAVPTNQARCVSGPIACGTVNEANQTCSTTAACGNASYFQDLSADLSRRATSGIPST